MSQVSVCRQKCKHLFLSHKNKRTKIKQHIKAKTIKNVFITNKNRTCMLATKFDFEMPNENAYNCVDILGYRL